MTSISYGAYIWEHTFVNIRVHRTNLGVLGQIYGFLLELLFPSEPWVSIMERWLQSSDLLWDLQLISQRALRVYNHHNFVQLSTLHKSELMTWGWGALYNLITFFKNSIFLMKRHLQNTMSVYLCNFRHQIAYFLVLSGSKNVIKKKNVKNIGFVTIQYPNWRL